MSGGRVLVTGAWGFVGRHVLAALAERTREGDAPLVVAAGRGSSNEADGAEPAGTARVALDVTDPAAVERVVRDLRPTGVIHLAAVAEPGRARADPRHAFAVNVMGTLSLAEALMRHAPDARLVHAGSSETYGASFNRAPATGLTEEAALAPQNAYAATKASADLMLGALAHDGLAAVRFRPFNHTGPGQAEAYVVSAFARQLARIERGEQEPLVVVGNLDARRDFLDVRDVADLDAVSAAAALQVLLDLGTQRGALGLVAQPLHHRLGAARHRRVRDQRRGQARGRGVAGVLVHPHLDAFRTRALDALRHRLRAAPHPRPRAP